MELLLGIVKHSGFVAITYKMTLDIETIYAELNNLYREWFYVLPKNRNILFWFSKDAQKCDKFLKSYENLLITLASDSSFRIFIWTHATIRQRIAMIILFDQIPRHIYRGSRFMYDFDDISLQMAKSIKFNQLNQREMVFAIMPFEHSEKLNAHRLGLKILLRYKQNHLETSMLTKTIQQFKKHTDVLKKFGEYPKRRLDYGEKINEMPDEIKEYIKNSSHPYI